jgi:hypothetical protein
MNVDWIGGVYAPPAVPRTPEMLAALALSETLIGELVNADQVLICTPMHNYSRPDVQTNSWQASYLEFIPYSQPEAALLRLMTSWTFLGRSQCDRVHRGPSVEAASRIRG